MGTIDRFRDDAIRWAADGAEGVLTGTAVREIGLRTAVLVEGVSDRVAVEGLAARTGRDLDAEGCCIVPIGGAMSIGRFLKLFADPSAVTFRGLCDANEAIVYAHGLEQAGFETHLTGETMAALGFYTCVADLEDELIRCLGIDMVEHVIAAHGDLRKLETFYDQPAQRDRSVPQRLRRFMGTTSGRKARYAQYLIDTLDPAHVPQPLALLMDSL